MLHLLEPAGLLLSLSAVVPILLHLFERFSAPLEDLPTLSLLSQKEISHRKTPSRLLLLAIRCLILLLLGLLLAGPVWIPAQKTSRPDTLLVLDNGPEMARTLRGTTLLQLAREHAGRIHDRLAATGRVRCRVLAPFPGQDTTRDDLSVITAARISVFEPDPEELSRWILRATAGRPESWRVVFITATGSFFRKHRSSIPVPVSVHYFAPAAGKNIAVTGIGGIADPVLAGKQYLLRVTLDNHDSAFSTDNRIAVRFDDEVLAVQQVSPGPGVTTVSVPVRFSAGSGILSVTLAEDEAAYDNTHARPLTVIDRLHVRLLPPFDRNPYLRAVLKTVARNVVVWDDGPPDRTVVFRPLHGGLRLPERGRLVFFPPEPVQAPGRMEIAFGDGRLLFSPSGNTNRLQFDTAFPGSAVPFPLDFRSGILFRMEYPPLLRPLFRHADHGFAGGLLRLDGLRAVFFPFSPDMAATGLLLHRSFPLFMQSVLEFLFQGSAALLDRPGPDEVRRSEPLKADGRWSGTCFRNAGRIIPANISVNHYRASGLPAAALIREASGAPAVTMEKIGTGTEQSPLSLALFVLVLLVLLKTAELFLLGRRR